MSRAIRGTRFSVNVRMVSSGIIPLVFFPSIGLTGFIFNATLLIAVCKSTPKALTKYSALLANSAIIEMITTSACIATIPRQITSLSEFVLIFHGPCNMIGAPLCWASFSLLINALLLSHFLLCASFAVRLYILIHCQISKTTVIITLMVVNGLNSFIFFSLFYEFTHTDINYVEEMEDGRIPADVSQLTIGVLFISRRFYTQITMFYVSSVSPIVFTCCLLMQRRIFSYLNDNKFGLSSSSLAVHRMVVKALRLQLIISFIASMGSSLLLLSIFEILRDPFLDYLQPAINCSVLVISPLVSITYVKPYREYILQKLRIQSSEKITPIVPAWSTTLS